MSLVLWGWWRKPPKRPSLVKIDRIETRENRATSWDRFYTRVMKDESIREQQLYEGAFVGRIGSRDLACVVSIVPYQRISGWSQVMFERGWTH